MEQTNQTKWKTVEIGIILASTSIAELAEERIDDRMDFLMTPKLTQDCPEIEIIQWPHENPNIFRAVVLHLEL